MRVLVTGGAGYVGSVSVEALVAAGHEVVVLDDLSKGHRGAVSPSARLVEGSYGDAGLLRALLRDTPVDAVLHCAARSLVGESIANPALYYRENVTGGVVLLEALREAGVRRLVFSSTAAVYGTPATVPIREDAVHAPINPYGETKRAFEGALRWYAGAYGLRSVSLRYFNVAGASAVNGEVHDPETHLIPNVLAAAEGRGEVTVFGTDYPTADGTCIRDYIHVVDVALAHVYALERLLADKGYDPHYGARPLKRVIQRLVQDPLALKILEGAFPEGSKISAEAKLSGDALEFLLGRFLRELRGRRRLLGDRGRGWAAGEAGADDRRHRHGDAGGAGGRL